MERAEENGAAHLLEHLVFRGGARYSSRREVSHAAQRLGAYLNGYLTHDLVAWHITVRIEDALDAIDLLTDIVGDTRLEPAEVELEREVVLDEIDRRLERPQVVADELLDRAAFGDHPLGRPVVGRADVVRELTADDLQSFRDRTYAPERGVAVMVGNLGRLPPWNRLAPLFERIPQQGPHAGFPAAPERPSARLADQRRQGRSPLRLAYRPGIYV